jgi:hypothetical protein
LPKLRGYQGAQQPPEQQPEEPHLQPVHQPSFPKYIMCVSFIHTHSQFLKSGKCHIQCHEKGILQVLWLMHMGWSVPNPNHSLSIPLEHTAPPLPLSCNLIKYEQPISEWLYYTHSQLSG